MPDRDDERPRKSWREIDRARESKRSGESPGQRLRLERSGTYSRYKSAADQFFSGDLIPESLRDKLDPTGEATVRQQAMQKLKTADGDQDFHAAAEEYLKSYPAPEDPWILERILSHPKPEVALQALEALAELAEDEDFVPPKSLPQRLLSLELTSDDDDLQFQAKRLNKKLSKRR